MTEIFNLFDVPDRQSWIEKMRKCDWDAGKWLVSLCEKNECDKHFGENSKVLLLAENAEILSFCTYVKTDEIEDDSMKPWIGFVYTFPEHRGHRYAGLLIEKCKDFAREQNYSCIYVSSEEVGLYEKYGFDFIGNRQSVHDYITGIFKCEL